MAINNYVKFQRGSQEAYNALKAAGTLDNNTLYFIYDETNNSTGALYMGTRVISGGDVTVASATLDDLADVIVKNADTNSFLVKDENDTWVAKSLDEVIALIQEKLKIDPTITEDISNLQSSVDDIVKNIGTIEESLEAKADLSTVNEELAKKADVETVNSALNNKANIDDVNNALNSKADLSVVNEELAKKADTAVINAALEAKADLSVVNEELAKKADAAAVNEILETKANIADIYTKEEVNNKVTTEINAAISKADHLQRKIISSLEEIDTDAIDAHLYIYMIPTGLQQDDDKYDEYMVINGIIEKVGSWEVDLTNYATKDEVSTKIDKDENARLMTLAEGNKLATIEQGAQVNLFDELSEHFFIENRKLNLNDLPVSKITNLQQLLDNKVNVQEGYTLLSPDDQKKLAALVIGENDDLAISGKVNADNVVGLDEWLEKNSGTQKGLSENNLTNDLYNKLHDSLLIKSIDTNYLALSQEGKLSVNKIDLTQVANLEEALAAKANTATVNTLQSKLDGISTTVEQHNTDIAEIKDILTWKNI